MHIKRIHEMIESLTECTKEAIESDQTCVGSYPIGEVVDMIKDLADAEYHARIAKALEEAEEDDKEEEKYLLKRFKEEYGDDEGRRYYDEWRYSSGRFAPKGRGMRRGFDETPYWHMTPEMYRDMDIDMDRMYSYPRKTGRERKTDRNYYGGDSGMRDSREGKSGMSRKTYMESKQMYSSDTPENKQHKMRDLETYMRELSDDVTEMISDSTPEEKTMLKAKLQTLVQHL